MLDKLLCEAFGIDCFMQWIMQQLDSIEDRIERITDPASYEAIKLEGAYHKLLEVRDNYCKYLACDT